MDLKPETIISQRTVLSPRLYKSLKILQLDATELKKLVQREINENPVLELPEPDDRSDEYQPEGDIWSDYMLSGRRRNAVSDFTKFTGAFDTAASHETLHQHLALQLEIEDLPEQQKLAGSVIIDNLSQAGYLEEPLPYIAREAGVDLASAEKALCVIQGFDPPGVAARNLGECLLNQMEERDRKGLPGKLVTNYLPQMARGALCAIAREMAVSLTQVQHAIASIRELDPEPGAVYEKGVAAAVIPDVFIRKSRDGWAVLANRKIMPTLRISRQCELLARSADDPETYRYLQERRERARQLIRDLRQRRLTITRVAEVITDKQSGFFEEGRCGLRPMKLRDVATELEISISTVSRAIKGKFMSTPQGIFEFKYFFTGGLLAGGDEEIACAAVKQRLKNIIEGENRSRPMSDKKLAERLRLENIKISRRTVAKYREELGVPSSCQRKVG